MIQVKKYARMCVIFGPNLYTGLAYVHLFLSSINNSSLVCSISANHLYLLPTTTTRPHCMPIPQYQLKGMCRLVGMLLLWNKVIEGRQRRRMHKKVNII